MSKRSPVVAGDKYDTFNPEPPPDRMAAAVPEVDPDEQSEWDLFDGRTTAITLCRPIMRDHRIAGPGRRCVGFTDPRSNPPRHVDCDSREHHLHLAIRWDPSRQAWTGPEAGHFDELLVLGVVANTAEAAERTGRQAERDALIGVGRVDKDEEGNPKRPALLELRELTTAQVQAQWRNELRGGPESVLKREAWETRSEAAEVRKAAREGAQEVAHEVAAVLREAIGEARTPRGRKSRAGEPQEPDGDEMGF